MIQARTGVIHPGGSDLPVPARSLAPRFPMIPIRRGVTSTDQSPIYLVNNKLTDRRLRPKSLTEKVSVARNL